MVYSFFLLQLLKCVVGMNLVSFWGERSPENEPKPSSSISAKENGFYLNCFQKPYEQLVQFLNAASAAKPLSVEVAGLVLVIYLFLKKINVVCN